MSITKNHNDKAHTRVIHTHNDNKHYTKIITDILRTRKIFADKFHYRPQATVNGC